jgi:siderophore synthetase component
VNPAARDPGALTCQALLNCLIREVSIPERQVFEQKGFLIIRLARSGPVLRTRLRRASAGLGPRVGGEVQVREGLAWRPVGWAGLAALIAAELTLATGVSNDEFTAQVRGSHAALATILRARRRPLAPPSTGDRYLASEQALVSGHRFHPAPKARTGGGWLRYAPEGGARFPLRFLGVREDVLAAEGDTSALDRLGGPPAPAGYRLLPAHPWQLRLLHDRLTPARRNGLLVDLGPGTRDVAPTSSVRTVYDPQADGFAKFSLNVRITNCVRTSAWYELAGSVLLTGLLRPVLAGLRTAYPGTVLLGEPGYRTAALADRDLYQGLAVIARDGLRRHLAPGVTPVLAAALTEPALTEPPVAPFTGRDPDWLLGWWEAYVGLLAPPVLQLLFAHGVVLEPHLQNVLAGLDAGDWPAQVVLRDLEGVKLVAARHEPLLASLPPRVARGLAYDRERGWNRVAYCLFVNHLAEVAAAIADACPGRAERLEAELWHRARRLLAGFGRTHGWTPELRALLSGVPLPAKANLKVRWARAADREASYVPVPNPLTGPFTEPLSEPATGPLSESLTDLLAGPRPGAEPLGGATPEPLTGPLRERPIEPALP